MNDEQAALTIAQLVHRSSFKSTIAQSIHYLKGIQRLPTLFFNTNTGRKKKISALVGDVSFVPGCRLCMLHYRTCCRKDIFQKRRGSVGGCVQQGQGRDICKSG